jgi:hypothetical protein
MPRPRGAVTSASPHCASPSNARCAVDETAAAGPTVEATDEAIRLTCALDTLERVQPRVDAWLRAAVGALSYDPGPAPFGEGPA